MCDFNNGGYPGFLNYYQELKNTDWVSEDTELPKQDRYQSPRRDQTQTPEGCLRTEEHQGRHAVVYASSSHALVM